MEDKRSTPEVPEGEQPSDPAARKKRAAPTIDLTATEVPGSQDAAPQQPDLAGEGDTRAAEEPPHAGRSGAAFPIAVFIAGVSGAAATLLILAVLWFSGVLPQTPAQSSPNEPAIDALRQRVSALETEIKTSPSGDAGLSGRLATAENALKSLGVALAALGHRGDDIAASAGQARQNADAAMRAVAEMKATMKTSAPVARADFDALDKRIAALEGAAQSAQSDISKIATRSSGNDRQVRLALSAGMLRDAVAAGMPYADELAAVKELGGDDSILAPLTSSTKTGVPTAHVLAEELLQLLPRMRKIADAAPLQDGFIERLRVNASRLVHIRPVGAPQGDRPSAVLARVDGDASKSDIAAALADLGKLSDAVRAPAQDWINRARASQAAREAARNYAAETARALAPKAASQ